CGGGCNPKDKNNTLCGYQNTVTNSLYLVLSLRLYQLETEPTKKAQYLAAASDQFKWFRDWFGVAYPDRSLLAIQSEGVLVRERASMYANDNPVNNFNSATFWAGDQGLVLGAMVDYVKATAFPNAQTWALQIAQAIPKNFTDQSQGYLLAMKPVDG